MQLFYQAWADDLVLFAASETDMKKMLDVLVRELAQDGLSVKEGSLELLCAGAALAGESRWEAGGSSLVVKRCAEIAVLGVGLDYNGSTLASVDYRINQGWSHFHARKSVLCSKRISLRSRMLRLRDTIFRTVLHGAGGWLFDNSTIARLDSFENSVLRLMLARDRRVEESDAEYSKRLNRSIRFYKDSFGWCSLAIMAAHLHISWHGHVFRHESRLRSLLEWRGRAWRDLNRKAESSRIVRFARPGPQHHWDDLLDRVDPHWVSKVSYRREWAALRSAKIPCLAPLSGHWHSGLGPLRLSSNRYRDWSRGCSLISPIVCSFVCDNKAVVDVARGKAASTAFPAHAGFLKWSLHFLEIWGLRKMQGCDSFLSWVPKSSNASADMLVNMVLSGSSDACDVQLFPASLTEGDILLVGSDGGARENPGPAAAASVLYRSRGPDVQLLGFWAVDLGISTSVHAEFEGACVSINLLLAWLLWSGHAQSDWMKANTGLLNG
jgi:hypothetical protein